MQLRALAPAAVIAALLYGCQSSAASRDEQSTEDPTERVKEVSTDQLKQWVASGPSFILIDVREDNEWAEGHAVKAVHIPRWTLSDRIGSVVPDKDRRIVLYCKGGARSAYAAITLQKMGYANVFSLSGGFVEYQRAGLPVTK